MGGGIDPVLELKTRQILAAIGSSGDGSGIASVFGKLAAIIAYVDTVESVLAAIAGYTDTLETKVGTNVDAAGTSTLFARLAQIAAYTDTVESVLNNIQGNDLGHWYDAADPAGTANSKLASILGRIGTNADAAGSSTLFARLAQIAAYTDQVEGFVDTLETKLGANTDGAGTSTVFARLAQIAAYVDTLESGVKIARNFYKGGYYTTSTSYQTALNISGSGTLKYIWLAFTGTSYYAKIKITVDGTVLVEQLVQGAAYNYNLTPTVATPNGLYIALVNDSTGLIHELDIDFASSLKIEVKGNLDSSGNPSSGSSTAYTSWGYNS